MFHHSPVHPKTSVPAEPVLALQLDGNGRYHKLSAGGLVPAERCWLHSIILLKVPKNG